MRVDGAHRLMNQPQRGIDILEHADRVGDHDIVERALDCVQCGRIFDIAQHEIQIGISGFRLGNRIGAEIDPYAARWLQRGEQISATAPKLQHALARRNQKLHELQVALAVSRVEPPRTVEFIAIGLEVPEQLSFPGVAWLQSWRFSFHCSLGCASRPGACGHVSSMFPNYRPRIRRYTVRNSISLSPSSRRTGFGPSSARFSAALTLSTSRK